MAMADQLTSGEAFADLSSWRKVAVTGRDSFGWLNDLVSADLSKLTAGRALQSLLLSPTGRVRAEFTAALHGEQVVLLQDPTQPGAIDALLSMYVLSSDVTLTDRTDALALFAVPGLVDAPDSVMAAASAPSCLGAGVDLIASGADHDPVRAALATTLGEAGPEEVEAWRVMTGLPRVGVDATGDDLPQECGLSSAVAFDKGCYLGQEAVAKVRNLGHPRRILLHMESESAVSRGAALHVNGSKAGEVTSALFADGRTVLLAKVRWDLREGPFRTAGGAALTPRWR